MHDRAGVFLNFIEKIHMQSFMCPSERRSKKNQTDSIAKDVRPPRSLMTSKEKGLAVVSFAQTGSSHDWCSHLH